RGATSISLTRSCTPRSKRLTALDAFTLAKSEKPNGKTPARAMRLAVLPDFREENWPSMDLCADMLIDRLAERRDHIQTELVRPPYRRRVATIPGLGQRSWAINGDRFLNRHLHYPRHLRKRCGEHDVFHICDHSYAHLAL